jgi:hypothetical protein
MSEKYMTWQCKVKLCFPAVFMYSCELYIVQMDNKKAVLLHTMQA